MSKYKNQQAIREKILERIDFLSEHWVKGDDRPPFSFGGWREEVADGIMEIIEQFLDEQLSKKEEEVVKKIDVLIDKMKGEMYLYEHHPIEEHILGVEAKSNEKEYRMATGTTVCATCRDRVEVGSPCKDSKYYPVWVNLKMYVSTLEQLKTKK